MARHGENIRKRADGRWEGRYKEYNQEKHRVIYRSVYANSYDTVKAKLNMQKNSCENSTEAVTVPDILFKTVALEWLQEISKNRKHSTYIKYRNIYTRHLAAHIGSYKTLEITALMLEKYVPETLSESLLKSLYCVVNQVFAFAKKRYGVCTEKLARETSKCGKKMVEVFSQEEQSRLLTCLHHSMDRFKLAILLCLFTGLRLGEVCALKWSDIDFQHRIISINRTVQRIERNGGKHKTALLESSPKSECSHREMPVSSQLIIMLYRFQTETEYVFGGGKPLEPRTLQYRFKKYLCEAGISDHKFHILRHTFATNCVESGVDAKSLSEMLGHSDVRITLNRYVHPSMATKREYLDRLERFYGQIFGQVS